MFGRFLRIPALKGGDKFRGEIFKKYLKPPPSWRIIPGLGSVVRITPIQSHEVRPFGRGPTTLLGGQKLTIVTIHQKLNGTESQRTPFSKLRSSY